MSALYDTDILLWSEQQAALLRRVAAGERINSGDIDWPDIIEEIESVGSEQLHAVRSLLLQALLHHLKAEAWPRSGEVPHWRSEARIARINAASRYAPSMRQRIDMADIFAKVLRAMPETIDGQPPLPLPLACPFTLAEILADA